MLINRNAYSWQTPKHLLMLVSIIVPMAFASWQALLNNFVIEKAHLLALRLAYYKVCVRSQAF